MSQGSREGMGSLDQQGTGGRGALSWVFYGLPYFCEALKLVSHK